MEKERLEVIHECEATKSVLLLTQQKLNNLETSLQNKESTVNMYQKSSEEKDIALVDLNHTLEKEQKEKIALMTHYTAQLNDQTELNRTLQRENELLKQEMDRQLETSSAVKMELEEELQSVQEQCASLDAMRGEQDAARHQHQNEVKGLKEEIQSLAQQLQTIAD